MGLQPVRFVRMLGGAAGGTLEAHVIMIGHQSGALHVAAHQFLRLGPI